jgi:hypothetical protein
VPGLAWEPWHYGAPLHGLRARATVAAAHVIDHFARTVIRGPPDRRPLSGPPEALRCQVALAQFADLLLDSQGQALDWFYGLFPSCATQQRAERTR